MKILWLSNSEDISDDVPEKQRAWFLAARKLEEHLGEPVEVITRVVWPDPKLPDLIEGWVRRYEPDIVMFRVNAYWYLYRSVPLRLRRRLGLVGDRAATAGERIGTSRFAKTRAFHVIRGALLTTVGGDTLFPARSIAELTEDCVRRIQHNESVRVIVHTSLDHWTSNPKPQAMVHRRLKAFCETVRAGYLGADPLRDPPIPDFYATGDRLHTNDEGHRWIAERQAAALIAAMEGYRPE